MLSELKKSEIINLNLTEYIYNFLLENTDLIDETLTHYNLNKDELDQSNIIYQHLRKEEIKLKRKGKKRSKKLYSRKIYPNRRWLFLYGNTINFFSLKGKKISESILKNLSWPAGDRDNFGEFLVNDYSETYIFGTFFSKKEDYVYNKTGFDRYGYIVEEPYYNYNYFPLVNSIYISFVIPYVLSRYSIKRNRTIPKGAFIFVYKGGGGGCLINTKCGNIAASCGHTFNLDFDNGYLINPSDSIIKSLINKKQFLIMLGDGTLAILSDFNMYINDNERRKTHLDKYAIDVGIAKVLKPDLDESYYMNICNIDNIKKDTINIKCYGSPSIIKRNSDSEHSCKISKLPNVKSNYCNWYPMFFHIKNGNIQKKNIYDYNFYHNALVWEGMSGGPIINNQGLVLGFHHSSQTDKYGVGIRADKLEDIFKNHLIEINGECIKTEPSIKPSIKSKKIRHVILRRSPRLKQKYNNIKRQENKHIVELVRRSKRIRKTINRLTYK